MSLEISFDLDMLTSSYSLRSKESESRFSYFPLSILSTALKISDLTLSAFYLTTS